MLAEMEEHAHGPNGLRTGVCSQRASERTYDRRSERAREASRAAPRARARRGRRAGVSSPSDASVALGDFLASMLGAPFVASSMAASCDGSGLGCAGDDDIAPHVTGAILGPAMRAGHLARDHALLARFDGVRASRRVPVVDRRGGPGASPRPGARFGAATTTTSWSSSRTRSAARPLRSERRDAVPVGRALRAAPVATTIALLVALLRRGRRLRGGAQSTVSGAGEVRVREPRSGSSIDGCVVFAGSGPSAGASAADLAELARFCHRRCALGPGAVTAGAGARSPIPGRGVVGRRGVHRARPHHASASGSRAKATLAAAALAPEYALPRRLRPVARPRRARGRCSSTAARA